MKKSKRSDWRVQGVKTEADVKPLGAFDEIVVGDWLHVEMMDNGSAFVRLGSTCFWVNVKRGITYIEQRDDGLAAREMQLKPREICG